MLSERQLLILELVINDAKSVDLDFLISYFEKSERTIRYDISTIRSALEKYEVELRYQSPRGFYIPINQRVQAERMLMNLQSLNNIDTIEVNETRNQELILAFAVNEYLSIIDLADVLYLSDRAISECIVNFNRHYKGLIEIKNKRGHGYFIDCPEHVLNDEVARLLKDHIEFKTSSRERYALLPDIIKKELKVTEFIEIENSFKKNNSVYKVWLTGKDFNYMISYLIIMYIRNKRRLHTNTDIQELQDDATSHYIKDILNSILSEENTLVEDIVNLRTVVNLMNLHIIDATVQDQELAHVMNDFIEYLKSIEDEGLSFDYNALKLDLLLHGQNFMLRTSETISLEEQKVLDDIKDEHSKYYRLAQVACDLYEEKFKTRLPEYELSYITIYLYKNVIREIKQKKAVVVGASGRGINNLLVTRIRNVLPQIEIVDSISFYQLPNITTNADIDFIISTIPIEDSPYPVIKISTVLTSGDIQKILEYLNDDSLQTHNYNSAIKNYFNEEVSSRKVSNKKDLQMHSTIVSEIILSLITFTTEISNEYPMSYDEILGLVIHLVMAIPRWYDDEKIDDIETIMKYKEIENSHENLAIAMDVFFENIENSLYISISKLERLSFYYYIIRRNK